MLKNKFLKNLVFVIIFILSLKGFSQLSKKHYIPPLTSSANGNANPDDQYIYISTPSLSNVSYTIIPVGQPTISYIRGTVSNTSPQQISIGTGNGQLFIPSIQSSVITNDKGYIIEALAPIYVSVRMNAGGGSQAGALVSKGLSALDTTFRIGTYTNENASSNYLNFLSVMATEDNTQVNFSDLPTGLIIKNYTGTIPINITLNTGESYTIATNSNDTAINQDGLIGCLINSSKPIVVNCGSANGSFSNGNGRDYGIDQIVGLSKIGSEYIFVKGDGDNAWENILIVAHTDNTSIRINGNVPTTTINSGDYFLIEGDEYSSNGNMFVETSQPVFAYQGIGGLSNNGSPSEANQGMFFVPPLSCENRGNVDNIALINNIGNINYEGGVSIVTKTGATVTINNNPITVPSNPVDGKPDYITYKVKGLSGNVSIQSNDELYCAYFNYNGAASSGSFYSGFASAPEINFITQFTTLGNCIPNITLEVANATNFDSFKWLFNDGSGFVDLMVTSLQLSPSRPGTYKLVGIITCTGKELESTEIPISICPDDNDNDGIIDNIDIDNDNDGILNCIESNGNVLLNIDNLNTPELIFQDNTKNNTLASGNYTTSNNLGNTNTFNGNSSGNFTSTLGNASSAENNYSIAFTEPVNIKFEETTTLPNTNIEDEYFIAKIIPNNKTITLIDPDNHLLIDSNFDGVFETGVSQISGLEIRFKINPSPTGTTPYQFLGHQVDGFTFIHKLENGTASSVFTGNLSLTCFKKDSDLDGIKDDFDLDSDNDGIPDIIENQGMLVTPSGTDADFNGLDDVFNSSILPIDTDNDTILDIYDLDSDNDGIYDIIETDYNSLSDTDLNGIEDGPYGVNGWTDIAETAPDSNNIGYTLNDLDNDTRFSYLDPDSDNDECNDVIEAGFSDGNMDNYLGDNTPTTDANGLVNNATNGYTAPNNNYLNIAPLTITTQPINLEICESSNNSISMISPEAESYQWEVSTDGVNWSAITNNAVYNNSETANLNITNAPLTLNTNKFRVKIDRTGNSCGLYSNEVELTINPLPVVNSPVVLVQCDDNDPSTLGFSPFNLTEVNNEISANAINETFTYYLTQSAAISGDTSSPNYINTPTTFINRTISTDVVWARIESSFGCASFSQIQLNVSTTILPQTFLTTFNQCDDFLDINGQDNANNNARDGIASFNFSSVTTNILSLIPSGQNALPPRYFRNEADALAEENEITDPSNYRNIGYPESQLIYVRIDSDISNDCLGLGPHIRLNVEPLPTANAVIAIQCDDDNDGLFPFNTSQIQNDILGEQNPEDVVIEYFDENKMPLPSPLPNPFITKTQTLNVRVTNKPSLALDGPCYNETTLAFTVSKQPVANPVQDQIVCDGDANDIDNNGIFPFDTSTFTNTILGTQTGMEISYNYTDINGDFQTNQPSLPDPFISRNQTITARVINPINTSCIASTNINFVINPLPDFTVDSPLVICTSDPSFSVKLEPKEFNPFEVFDYSWSWTSLNGQTNEQSISNSRILTASKPGIYTITLTKTDGTGCSRSRQIRVNASELATITNSIVTIVDTSQNNSVTINTTSIGIGNYQFALQEEGSTFIVFQDEPFFNNVNPGIHTIHVKDDICGIATLDISVVGFPKYFTPNGDGINDVWKIIGVNKNFQPNSTIHIYDRYGKLLKQLFVQDNGWDGTFNGTLLPTDDYWFQVALEDGRNLSGHFTLKR